MKRSLANDASDDLVTIGRVVKAHGIRGEVAVHLLTDLDERFAPGVKVRVGNLDVRVAASRPHQGRMLVQFEGVTDRTAAERLRGADIKAEPLDLDDHEHFFAHELMGLVVVDAEGGDLGTVSALIELPDAAGYDLLEVTRADGAAWLLPASDDIVEVELDDEPTEVDTDVHHGAGTAGHSREAAGQSGMRLVVTNPPVGLLDGEPDVVRPDDPSKAP